MSLFSMTYGRLLPLSALLMSGTVLGLAPPTDFQMAPQGVHVPMIEVSTGTEVTTSDQAAVEVLLGVEFNGIKGKEEGQYIARVYVEGGMNPVNGDIGSFKVEFTPYREIHETNPVPISWETRYFNTTFAYDQRTGQNLDGTIQLLGFRGGIFLPASDPGDFEAMVVISLEALGGKIRQYANDQLATFYGAYVAGASLDATLGYQINQDFKVSGTFGLSGDLSLGAAGGNFSALLDSELHLDLVLSWRNMIDLVLGGSFENYSDTGNDKAYGVAKFLATLRFRF